MSPIARRPVVIAYHLVWTGYGTWLPNDPRGSGSRAVHAPRIAELGPLHYGRRAIQPGRRTVARFYEESAARLAFPVLRFCDSQRRMIAEALAEAIRRHRFTCYACAILPDHVHSVIRKHKLKAEEMIAELQASTRLRLSSSASIPGGPSDLDARRLEIVSRPARRRS
jgi:hypothetical protein